MTKNGTLNFKENRNKKMGRLIRQGIVCEYSIKKLAAAIVMSGLNAIRTMSENETPEIIHAGTRYDKKFAFAQIELRREILWFYGYSDDEPMYNSLRGLLEYMGISYCKVQAEWQDKVDKAAYNYGQVDFLCNLLLERWEN